MSRVYSVSRTKIRAALLILSKDKLINIVPDKGAFVSQPSEAEARDVFATRRIIEAALAAAFVAKARPADYTRLEKHIRNERAAMSSQDPKQRSQLLGDFHVLLAQLVGNQVAGNSSNWSRAVRSSPCCTSRCATPPVRRTSMSPS